MPLFSWRSRAPLFVASCLLGAGCVNARVAALQSRLDAIDKQRAEQAVTLENQNLRWDSVATGLEKMTQRLDLITPASAQWLKLEKGTAIKWYLDDQAQNVYVQYLDVGPQPGSILVSLSTKARTSQHVLRPGEAIEHRWTTPIPPRSFIVTCHRILHAEDGASWGLFSILEGPLPGLG